MKSRWFSGSKQTLPSHPLALFLLCLPAFLLALPEFAPAVPLEIEEPLSPPEEQAPNGELEQDRLHAKALFSAGWMLERRGKKLDALRKYQRAFRYDPQIGLLLQEILRLAAELDRDEQAIEYLLLAVDRVPPDAKLLRPLALVLVRQGKWDQALKLYQVILKGISPERKDFESLTIRQEAGRLFYLTGQLAEGAAVSDVVEKALAEPRQFELTAEQEKELLGEPGLSYHLFAECHLAAGELNRARECFETANKHQPSPGLHGYNLARVEEKAGHVQQALEELQAYFTAKLGSEGSAPYELLARLLAQQASGESLDEALARLSKADPTNSALTLFMAERFLAQEKYEQAETLFNQLVEQGSRRKRDQVYQGLVKCQRELHHPEPLLETLTKADASLLEELLPLVAKDKELTGELFELAQDRRKPTAQKLPPANQSWVIAQLALAAQDFESAQAFYQFALQDQPEQKAELTRQFALGLLQAEQSAEAIGLLEKKLVKEDPDGDHEALLSLLATALAMDGKYDRALEIAKKVEQLKPSSGLPSSQLADILRQAGRFKEAEEVYIHRLLAFEEHPDSELARRQANRIRKTLSYLCLQRGDIEQSEEWLEQVLDDYPTDAGALNDLSYLWADQNKHPQRALRMIRQAIEQDPENSAYLDTLAWAQYRVGEYGAAKAALEKALAALEEPDPVMLDHLGDVCQQLEEQDLAQQHWRQALEIIPDGEQAELKASLQKKLSAEK